eukprot:6471328-Amphidinium_carterae.1
MIAPNGQLMIALVNPYVATPPKDPRWGEPSRIVSRFRCGICGAEDKADNPLQICWHEDSATRRKCGKRFCYNKNKQCGSRVAYNIRPPAPSGLKDFPDCVWCKKHEGILLPADKFKHKIEIWED